MLDCGRARELMDACFDGELGPPEAALLSDHLARCARCRSEQGLALAVDRALEQELPARAPAWLAASVSRRIVRREQFVRGVQTSLIAAGLSSAVIGTLLGLRATSASVELPSVGHAAGRAFTLAADRLGALSTLTPGLLTEWSGNPGVVGVALALAAASCAYIAIAALRSARELVLEWR